MRASAVVQIDEAGAPINWQLRVRAGPAKAARRHGGASRVRPADPDPRALL